MKLWRKLAEKQRDDSGQVVRNGRQIRYGMWLQEQFIKKQVKTYPLLTALFQRVGMKKVLSKKEQAALEAAAQKASTGDANATV